MFNCEYVNTVGVKLFVLSGIYFTDLIRRICKILFHSSGVCLQCQELPVQVNAIVINAALYTT
jgi:hypothetical protein